MGSACKFHNLSVFVAYRGKVPKNHGHLRVAWPTFATPFDEQASPALQGLEWFHMQVGALFGTLPLNAVTCDVDR